MESINAHMYTEVLQLGAIERLRKGVDPTYMWYTDDELCNILAICSCVLDRAVVKCLLGIAQKAKARKDSQSVINARNMLNRFEAGFIQI